MGPSMDGLLQMLNDYCDWVCTVFICDDVLNLSYFNREF